MPMGGKSSIIIINKNNTVFLKRDAPGTGKRMGLSICEFRSKGRKGHRVYPRHPATKPEPRQHSCPLTSGIPLPQPQTQSTTKFHQFSLLNVACVLLLSIVLATAKFRPHYLVHECSPPPPNWSLEPPSTHCTHCSDFLKSKYSHVLFLL